MPFGNLRGYSLVAMFLLQNSIRNRVVLFKQAGGTAHMGSPPCFGPGKKIDTLLYAFAQVEMALPVYSW